MLFEVYLFIYAATTLAQTISICALFFPYLALCFWFKIVKIQQIIYHLDFLYPPIFWKYYLYSVQIKHFPIIKRIHLKSGKADNDTINAIVDRILPRFAHTPMKIKIVVGQKLFQRKSQEIKKIIENSTHFQ